MPTSGAAESVSIVARRRAASQRDLFAANLAWWRSDKPGAGQFIRWDYSNPAGPQDTSTGCPGGGKTLFENDTSDSIHVVVDCPAAAALVFKVTYHPDWIVTVDKHPVETFMVSPSYVGIDLPAGKHDVQAVYTAAPSKLPLLIVGLVALLVAALLRRRLDWLPTRLGEIRISRPRRASRPVTASTNDS